MFDFKKIEFFLIFQLLLLLTTCFMVNGAGAQSYSGSSSSSYSSAYGSSSSSAASSTGASSSAGAAVSQLTLMCFRGRDIQVPSSLLKAYVTQGATYGACVHSFKLSEVNKIEVLSYQRIRIEGYLPGTEDVDALTFTLGTFDSSACYNSAKSAYEYGGSIAIQYVRQLVASSEKTAARIISCKWTPNSIVVNGTRVASLDPISNEAAYVKIALKTPMNSSMERSFTFWRNEVVGASCYSLLKSAFANNQPVLVHYSIRVRELASSTLSLEQLKYVKVTRCEALPKFTLTIGVSEGGDVESLSDSSIKCLANEVCPFSPTLGSLNILKAYPMSGFNFARWEGPCGIATDKPDECVTRDEGYPKSITAIFEKKVIPQPTLEISVTEGGKVYSLQNSLISCTGPADCKFSPVKGELNILKAIPALGYKFVKWESLFCGIDPARADECVTRDEAYVKSMRAVFEKVSPSFSVNATPVAGIPGCYSVKTSLDDLNLTAASLWAYTISGGSFNNSVCDSTYSSQTMRVLHGPPYQTSTWFFVRLNPGSTSLGINVKEESTTRSFQQTISGLTPPLDDGMLSAKLTPLSSVPGCYSLQTSLRSLPPGAATMTYSVIGGTLMGDSYCASISTRQSITVLNSPLYQNGFAIFVRLNSGSNSLVVNAKADGTLLEYKTTITGLSLPTLEKPKLRLAAEYGGRVESLQKPAIACQGSQLCEFDMLPGEVNTLRAYPSFGWEFSRWEGNCVVNPLRADECKVTSNTPFAFVRAIFKEKAHSDVYLSIGAGGNVTDITGSRGYSAYVPAEYMYVQFKGTTHTLIATNNAWNSRFVRWQGDCNPVSVASNECKVTADGTTKRVAAIFETYNPPADMPITFTASANPISSGCYFLQATLSDPPPYASSVSYSVEGGTIMTSSTCQTPSSLQYVRVGNYRHTGSFIVKLNPGVTALKVRANADGTSRFFETTIRP